MYYFGSKLGFPHFGKLPYWDNGKENGNYYNGRFRVHKYKMVIKWDNGKENGNYHNGPYRIYIGVILGIWKRKWKLV